MKNDLGKIMQQAQLMQERMKKAQAELNKTTVKGTAGGGAITMEMTGRHEVVNVQIDPSALDNPEILGDLIAAVVNDCTRQVEELTRSKLSGLTSGMSFPNEGDITQS